MQRTVLIGLFIAAIGAAMIASLGTSNLAFAQANNLFGQEAKQLAQCSASTCVRETQDPNDPRSAMGEHSADTNGGGARTDPGRVGIGNVGEDILGIGKSTPSEAIGALCGNDGSGCP
jgi:hypothetical protein